MKLKIIVRFTNSLSSTENLPDLTLPISVNFDKDNINKLITVNWLKGSIRSKSPQCNNKRLKLIYNGRVLNDKTDFDKEVLRPRRAVLNEDDPIYIHCVVGERLTKKQLEEENRLDNLPQQVSTTPDVIGFDRLLQQGFSAEDVQDLRRQFLSLYGGSLAAGSGASATGAGGDAASSGREIADVEEIENRQRELRELEERWIESTSNNDSPGGGGVGATGATSSAATAAAATQNSLDGDNTETHATQPPSLELEESQVNEDLLLGFLVGIFLGVISVVFLLLDDTIFNKRQKMSVIAGLFINFSLAIVRGQWL
ncbi:uncharacterized protein LODBEIA_P16270 [Lodderomyces beijingensis]|uniref:Ubiquitin-like domain-containing protein n=1 Tax=Lodderomyces beijingensis TaxID=1775926 RepID=A0ABP0ZGW8_9ASCO